MIFPLNQGLYYIILQKIIQNKIEEQALHDLI